MIRNQMIRIVGAISIVLLGLAPLAASAQYPGINGRIYFVTGPGPAGPYALKSMNPDGTQVRTILATGAPDNGFSISKDGTKIVGANDIGIVTYDIDGSNMQQVTTDDTGGGATTLDFNPTWTPDGTAIYYSYLDNNTVTNGGIYGIYPDGSNKTQFVANTSTVHYASPTVSPDDSQMAFQGTTYTVSAGFLASATSGTNIYTSTWQGTSVTNQTNTSSLTYLHPDWSPDGTQLLFQTGLHNVATIPAGGGSLTTLAVGGNVPTFAQWSPDGTRLLMTDNTDVFTANADATGLTNITNGTYTDGITSAYWSTVPVITASAPTVTTPSLPNAGGLSGGLPIALIVGMTGVLGVIEVRHRVRRRS